MADEAYRAVFLRVHPTGQDGAQPDHRGRRQRGASTRSSSPTSSASRALDVKVVPADTDRFGAGHGYNTSPSDGTPGGDRRARPSKIRAKAQLLAGVALGRRARDACSGTTARGRRRRRDPTQVKTIADIALYAHGTGALPPGRRGRPRRADRLPRLSSAGRSIATSTSSATFRAPNSAEYGFMPQSVCLTTALPLSRARRRSIEVEGDRRVRRRRSVSSPSTRSRAVRRGRTRGRAERDGAAASAPRRRSSARCSPCRRRRAPASRRCPRRTRSDARVGVELDARRRVADRRASPARR